MNLRRLVSWSLVAAAALLMTFAVLPPPVEAGSLRAKVFLTQRKIPKKLSARGLLGFVRRNATRRLRETRSGPLDKRKFKAEMVASSNRPPNDLEFHVLFYDIHDGAPKFIEDLGIFVNDRKEKIFLQRVKLPRPRFKPNRRMKLVVTVRRQEVGSLKFITDGEEVRRSGKVDFSDDET